MRCLKVRFKAQKELNSEVEMNVICFCYFRLNAFSLEFIFAARSITNKYSGTRVLYYMLMFANYG